MDTGITRFGRLDAQQITQNGRQIGGGGEIRYDGTVLPSAGTPTIEHCKTVVEGVAASLAERILRHSAVLQIATRQTYVGALTGNENVPMNGAEVDINVFRSYTEAHPVDKIAASVALMDRLADRIATQFAAKADFDLLSLYNTFTTHGTAGTGGVALTDATHIVTQAAKLKALGEPIFAILDPLSFATDSVLADICSEALQSDSTARIDLTHAMVSATGTPTATVFNIQQWTPVLSRQVSKTGVSPITIHNLVACPSALCFASGVQQPGTSGSTVGAVSTHQGVSARVYITNTGSGNQTIIATMFYGVARGIETAGAVVRA